MIIISRQFLDLHRAFTMMFTIINLYAPLLSIVFTINFIAYWTIVNYRSQLSIFVNLEYLKTIVTIYWLTRVVSYIVAK